MGADMVFIRSWWFNRRLQYNKALLFTGLMGFLAQALFYTLKGPNGNIGNVLPTMFISGFCFLVYLSLANIIFTIGPVIDFLFNHEDSSRFREQLFDFGYWLAIGILVLFIGAFLWFMV